MKGLWPQERRRNGIILLLVLGLWLGWAPGIFAHAELVAAAPGPGARLREAPAEIRLTFSEPVAAQSNIVVLGADFAPLAGLVPQLNTAVPEEVYVPLPPLETGSYTVQWTAVSADGHEISGSYGFTIVEGGNEDAGGQQTAGTGVIGWLLALAAVALLMPFAIVWYRRHGRKP